MTFYIWKKNEFYSTQKTNVAFVAKSLFFPYMIISIVFKISIISIILWFQEIFNQHIEIKNVPQVHSREAQFAKLLLLFFNSNLLGSKSFFSFCTHPQTQFNKTDNLFTRIFNKLWISDDLIFPIWTFFLSLIALRSFEYFLQAL